MTNAIAEARATMREHTTSLLSKHDIRLWPLAENHVRFTALFRATWKRLPLGVRRQILRHWRTGFTICPEWFPLSPVIEIVPLIWPRDAKTEEEAARIWGNVTALGHKVQFSATIIDKMPDAIAQDLIAHELAHVHQFACGMISEIDNGVRWDVWPNGDKFAPGDTEEDADEQMLNWGFSSFAMDEWAQSVGIAAPAREVSFGEFFEAYEHFLETGDRSWPGK